MSEERPLTSIEVERSDNNGYAAVVTALAEPKHYWWKWYQFEGSAYDDLAQLGYARLVRHDECPSENRYSANVGELWDKVPEKPVDGDRLTSFGFELRKA